MFGRIVTFLIAVVLTSSCKTFVYVHEWVEPEIQLPDGEHNMVVQNMFDFTDSTKVKYKHQPVYESSVLTFRQALQDYLLDEPLISAITTDSLISISNNSTFNTPDKDFIQNICKRYNSDFFLAINSIKIGFDYDVEVTEYDDGSKSKTKHFYLQLNTELALYNWDGEMVNYSQVFRQRKYKSRPTLGSLITIYPSLAKAEPSVAHLAQDAAIEYGKKFFKQRQGNLQKVYWSKPFGPSLTLMHNKQWKEAIKELEVHAMSPNAKIARKAAHNLHVAYLGLGDKAKAKYWQMQSQDKK